jgi:hypothetical protein
MLKSDAPVEKVLGESVTVIPFESLEKIESDLQYNAIDAIWRPERKQKPKKTTLNCADAESRDEILTTLLDRLGTNWQRELHRYGRIRATWPALSLIALVLSFWAVMAALPGLNPRFVLHGGWRESLFGLVLHAMLHVFGSNWVFWLIIPGIIWFVGLALKPPIMLTLRDRRWQ